MYKIAKKAHTICMKKFVNLLLGCILISGVCTKEAINSYKNCDETPITAEACFSLNEEKDTKSIPLSLKAKAAYIMDGDSGELIYSQNAQERLPIASMCKIMTLILSFEGIEEGKFTLSDEIQVSERAASMGGSQVFLEANAKYPAKELIKSIVVCSANDSCVAMAEKISGSEEAFTQAMNEKAKKLGAMNTLFANCTGLPKEPQYSCAHDVALMLKELLTHKEYFEFGKVWMDKFQHPQGRYTEISNTNKLVRFYDGCDGGKTGFTSQAGFCLAATAKRDNLRIISVVIGEKTSNERFADVRTMFDYAFANYTQKIVVDSTQPLPEKIKVSGGKLDKVSVRANKNLYAFSKRGDDPYITTEVRLFNDVKAPLKKGEKIGEIVLYKNKVRIDCADLLTCEKVEKATVLDRFHDVAEEWMIR